MEFLLGLIVVLLALIYIELGRIRQAVREMGGDLAYLDHDMPPEPTYDPTERLSP